MTSTANAFQRNRFHQWSTKTAIIRCGIHENQTVFLEWRRFIVKKNKENRLISC